MFDENLSLFIMDKVVFPLNGIQPQNTQRRLVPYPIIISDTQNIVIGVDDILISKPKAR